GCAEVTPQAAADLTDVEAALGPRLHVETGRPMHVDPLRLELAVAVEYLDAMVLAVGDVDPAVSIAADVVRDVELTGIGTRLAPRAEQRAVRRELVHARVAVPVGHVDVALRRERGVRAAMEGLAAHVGLPLAGDSQGQ